jgi:hypothetical protein
VTILNDFAVAAAIPFQLVTILKTIHQFSNSHVLITSIVVVGGGERDEAH